MCDALGAQIRTDPFDLRVTASGLRSIAVSAMVVCIVNQCNGVAARGGNLAGTVDSGVSDRAVRIVL